MNEDPEATGWELLRVIGLGVLLPLLCCSPDSVLRLPQKEAPPEAAARTARRCSRAPAPVRSRSPRSTRSARSSLRAASPRKRWWGGDGSPPRAEARSARVRPFETSTPPPQSRRRRARRRRRDDDLENIGERLSFVSNHTVRDGACAARAMMREAARRLSHQVVGDTARLHGGVRAAIEQLNLPPGRRRGAEPRRAHAAVDGASPLAPPQFASGAAFTSQFEQLRGPGGQVSSCRGSPTRVPTGSRPARRRRSRAAAADGPRAAPRRLRPGDADAGRLGAEQVSVPRDEGRSSCVYAHRRDMEEVAFVDQRAVGGPPPPPLHPCAARSCRRVSRPARAAVVLCPTPLAARPLGRL